MEKFDRNKAIEIADNANKLRRDKQFIEILNTITNHAKQGAYSMCFHRNRLTKYDKEKLIERGFDVELEDTRYLVSWTKKTEE